MAVSKLILVRVLGYEKTEAENGPVVGVAPRRRVAVDLGGPVEHRLDVGPRELGRGDEVVLTHWLRGVAQRS